MKAKIGNLAIAKFGGRNNREICIITGKYEQLLTFFYWTNSNLGLRINYDSLPANRLIPVQPKGKWNGNILKLTPNNVEPV